MDIVEELRNDRERGARRLESEYRAGLMTLARRFCADEGDAEELVNRTFAAVVEGIDDYIEQSAFFAWMCRILSNIHAKDARRKMGSAVVADPAAVDAAADPASDQRIFQEVDAGLLRDAVQDLPPDIRNTLLLHYFMDIPVREVARVLSVPSGTVKWRLHYARMILAAKLGTLRPGARLILLALLLAAGLAVGRGVYALASAALSSHAESAESAEFVSHAESAEFAEAPDRLSSPVSRLASHAENAAEGGFERAQGALGTPEEPASNAAEGGLEPSPLSPPESSEMNAKSLLAVSSLALATTSASAATDHWTYTPPASGTQGTISWTDSSGFENVVKGAVLSGGQITFAHSKNTSNANLKNLDLSIPVYAEDGTTQYDFSPYALGDKNQGGRIVSGSVLTNVVLHAGCKSLGRYCFKECTALVSVTLNDGLEEICEEAFRGDKALATVVNFFPDSLKTIGVYAFFQCYALSGRAVANGLTRIDDRAFHSCSSLQGFDCGGSTLAAISISAFYKNTALESVVLPDTITNIGNSVFYQCSSLTNFSPLLPPALKVFGNATGSANDRPIYDCPIQGHVVSPNTLTNLLSYSFRGTHIETFTSPRKGLRSIGEYAFSRCSYLTNVVLSADLESISASWMYGVASTGEAHVWFRNLPTNLPGNLWANTTKQHITIHLPWSQQEAWRTWVESGPSGHTFTFNNATKTLPETIDDVGTWQSGITQNVTWWKDAENPTLVVVK